MNGRSYATTFTCPHLVHKVLSLSIADLYNTILEEPNPFIYSIEVYLRSSDTYHFYIQDF
jgi:hypothetical protein